MYRFRNVVKGVFLPTAAPIWLPQLRNGYAEILTPFIDSHCAGRIIIGFLC